MALVLATLSCAATASAITVPPGFVVENAVPASTFTFPVSVTFLPDGRFIVSEQQGIAYMVVNGVKRATPVWSATAEVLKNGDRGLLGVAVDPHFYQNHYVYFLYTVDPDSNGVDDNQLGFGRLTRYQMRATGDTNTVDPATRTVLMGQDWRRGKLDAGLSHSIGSLRWGSDGSLLVSEGEGAEYNGVDPGGLQPTAFGPTRTDPNEDIGAFRAQDITNICGKILRLNPATGQGYPSNPFATADLNENQSKVFQYGLRNPFRFTIKPGTGSANVTAGNPGTLFIGDVGWETWEEFDIATQPGQNFGWPCYEGLTFNTPYQAATPSHNGCGSVGTATNPNPWKLPESVWHHYTSSLSVPPGVFGVASVGGMFYARTTWPGAYRGRYFFSDYGGNWIRMATVSDNNKVIALSDFGTSMDAPVDLQPHPATGDMYYASITTGQIRRIRWTGAAEGNAAPVAHVDASVISGAVPLTVNFSGADCFDPENDALTYAWDFGDGGTSTQQNPSHTFTSTGSFAVVLTVNDGHAHTAQASVAILVGQPAPFPSTGILDNFNRSNRTLDGAWTGSISPLSITGNQLQQTCCFSTPVWSGNTFAADQEAYIRLATLGASGEIDLVLKSQGTSYTNAHLQVRYDGTSQQVAVDTYDPAVGWVNFGYLPAQFASGDQFGVRALANGTVGVFKNGALLGNVSIVGWAYYTQGGSIGMTLDTPSTNRLDDFGGGTYVPVDPNPVVTLTAPNGGESWGGGTQHNILWTASDDQGVTGVDVFYKDHAASAWTTLAINAPNSGTFSWWVHNTPTTDARVKVLVRDADGHTAADSSDANFAITATPGGIAPTTLRDFQMPGTQPLQVGDLASHDVCYTCHGGYDAAVEPGRNFRGIMMAQAARDPLFYACLAVAEQDAPSAGDLCIRCHSPQAWLSGKSQPTSGARIDAATRDGVNCDFCHRLVDPIYQPGVNPPEDQAVLDAMPPAQRPTTYSNGQYVLDGQARPRGPFSDAEPPHSFLASSFHTRSEMCGTCHDVSNPVYERVNGARYAPGPLDAPATSFASGVLLPLERTFSEWKNSSYPAGVYAPDFAGNAPGGIVSSCQDCHTRQVTGQGCNSPGAPVRNNLPLHDFTGGNTFIGSVVAALYPGETDAAALAAGSARAEATLQKAATLDLSLAAEGDSVRATVRVTNRTGHKLPTGYPEGRRMWLNIEARDSNGALLYASCPYDTSTGVLTPGPQARVYEMLLGISKAVAPVFGLPHGASFHFALNDSLYKDNRIPPLGFTNAAFDAFGGKPADPELPGTRYPDGQNWDESTLALPVGTATVTATLYYQTTSKEYVEFLRDANVTNGAGTALFNAWNSHSRSTPVVMATKSTSTAESGAPERPSLPTALALRALRNPFLGALELELALPHTTDVMFDIFDVSGRNVAHRPLGRLEPGLHRVSWDGLTSSGQTAGAGVYWAVIRADERRLTQRVVRLR